MQSRIVVALEMTLEKDEDLSFGSEEMLQPQMYYLMTCVIESRLELGGRAAHCPVGCGSFTLRPTEGSMDRELTHVFLHDIVIRWVHQLDCVPLSARVRPLTREGDC